MSETNEAPEELPESPDSEPIEQPEIIGTEPVEVVDVYDSKTVEVVDAYDMETVELPAEYAPRNVDKFGPQPMDMICPECGLTITTVISTETTRFDSTSCFYACLNACFGGIVSNQNKLNFLLVLRLCDGNFIEMLTLLKNFDLFLFVGNYKTSMSSM
jgi:hypothetical protein